MDQLRRSLGAIVFLSVLCAPIVHSQSSKPSPANETQRSNVVLQEKQHDDGQLKEEFSFLIKNFKIDHQSESINLNISISYRYVVNISNSDYPDFRLLAKDVETFLRS